MQRLFADESDGTPLQVEHDPEPKVSAARSAGFSDKIMPQDKELEQDE